MLTAAESTLKPFYNEAVIDAGGGIQLRLVMNFRTIDMLEGLLGRGMDELLGELSTSTGMMGKFIWAMTREHHASLSLDQIAGLMFDPRLGPPAAVITGDLIKRAFHMGSPEPEGEKSSRPPRRSVGASRGSSKSGSRRASRPAASGKKRRARS